MSFEKENDPAVEYARAKVEEIRKKLAHNPPLSNAYESKRQKNYPIQKQTSRVIDKPVVLGQSVVNKEYENRIQNINSINSKIKSILGSQQKSSYSRQKISERKKQNSIPKKVDESYKYKINSIEKSASKLSDFGDKGYSKQIQFSSKLLSSKDKLSEFQFSNKLSKYNQPTVQKQLRKQLLKDEAIEKKSSAKKQYKIEQSKISQSIVQNYRTRTVSVASSRAVKPHEKKSNEEYGRKQITSLAQILGKQVKLDQKLRQCKWQFSEWQQKDKWDKLYEKIKGRNIKNIANSELKEIFEISPQQHNPFFQSSNFITEQSIEKLLNAYEQAQQFWANKLSECVSILKLQEQCFNIRDIDSSNKGYINVQDLVCFINLYTGNFFRNRDIISIHKRFLRLQGKKQLQYETFLDKVTKR